MKPVIVVWKDAHAGLEGVTLEEAKNMEPLLTASTGWLVFNGPEGVCLTTDSYEDEEETSGTFDYSFIPRGMIVKIHYLSLPEIFS